MINGPTDVHEGLGLPAADARQTLRARGAEPDRRHRREAKRNATVEELFLGDPSTSLGEAVEKARYLLALFAATAEAQSVDRQRGIARVLDDLSSFAE
jgi:hypothetical protein